MLTNILTLIATNTLLKCSRTYFYAEMVSASTPLIMFHIFVIKNQHLSSCLMLTYTANTVKHKKHQTFSSQWLNFHPGDTLSLKSPLTRTPAAFRTPQILSHSAYRALRSASLSCAVIPHGTITT